MKLMRVTAVQILFLLFAVAIFVTSLPRLAEAQSEGSGSSTTAKKPAANTQNKRTTVNFEDQLVEGQTQKPELFYLLQQRNNNFKRLIKLRENFLPEMRKTSEEMNGKGSGS